MFMLNNLNFNELYNFVQILNAGSFTKAAERLGVTTSALSQSVKSLETQLDMRLLNRTTRSISPTEAGEKLLAEIAPHFLAISNGIRHLDELRDEPHGIIRINTSEMAAREILYPKLKPFLKAHPHIKVELMIEPRWVDIVAQGFDMGVRLGYALFEDMISVRISEPLKMALVASPAYLRGKSAVKKIEDLINHDLIAGRFSSEQGVDPWEFNVKGETVRFTPDAQFLSNGNLQYQAVKDGFGIGWLSLNYIKQDLADGTLTELLPKFAKIYDPLYLYYPNRKGNSKAFQMIVDLLRVH